MNENEAAEFLGISRATLRNRRWRREPPIYRKLGPRTVRYHRADLEAFARPVNVPDAP
jgi:predicted DNA-binding transcriptional regulator AlpA